MRLRLDQDQDADLSEDLPTLLFASDNIISAMRR